MGREIAKREKEKGRGHHVGHNHSSKGEATEAFVRREPIIADHVKWEFGNWVTGDPLLYLNVVWGRFAFANRLEHDGDHLHLIMEVIDRIASHPELFLLALRGMEGVDCVGERLERTNTLSRCTPICSGRWQAWAGTGPMRCTGNSSSTG